MAIIAVPMALVCMGWFREAITSIPFMGLFLVIAYNLALSTQSALEFGTQAWFTGRGDREQWNSRIEGKGGNNFPLVYILARVVFVDFLEWHCHHFKSFFFKNKMNCTDLEYIVVYWFEYMAFKTYVIHLQLHMHTSHGIGIKTVLYGWTTFSYKCLGFPPPASLWHFWCHRSVIVWGVFLN